MQVVGFFMVEERVQAGCGEAGQGWQLNSSWESALANLKGRLEAACASYQDPVSIRSLKDFTLLSCSALGAVPLPTQCALDWTPNLHCCLTLPTSKPTYVPGHHSSTTHGSIVADHIGRCSFTAQSALPVHLYMLEGLAMKHQVSALPVCLCASV